MNLPDKCPFCGASVAINAHGEKCGDETWVAFDCVTSIHQGVPQFHCQSQMCKDIERIQLRARVAELEARCKRLEEASRNLYFNCIASGSRWTKQQTKHMHALRDVLEAKP